MTRCTTSRPCQRRLRPHRLGLRATQHVGRPAGARRGRDPACVRFLGLFVNADKYAQAGEDHHRALRYQINLFFDLLLPREKYGLLRQWVLHYVEDEAPDRLMPEAETVARLSELGFADLEIADRRYMDAVLVAHKP